MLNFFIRSILSIFFCLPLFANEVHVDKEINLSVLQSLCQNQLDEDIYLKEYIQNLNFENYGVYLVENRDFYFVEKETPDVIKIHVIKKGHLWERSIYDLLKKYTKPGSTAVDVGAHIGTHTIALSRFVGDGGLVVAFEPQLKLFSELAVNTYLNDFKNVLFFRRAIGETTTWTEMGPTNTTNEGNTILGEAKGGDKVKMERLDSFNLTNVSVIKIDVEGYEMNVIAGGLNTILRNKPVMLIEIWRAPGYEEKVRAIENLGYTSTYLSGDDFLFLPL